MANYYGQANIILDGDTLILNKAEGKKDLEIKLTAQQSEKLSTEWQDELINADYIYPDVNSPCPHCKTEIGNIRQVNEKIDIG